MTVFNPAQITQTVKLFDRLFGQIGPLASFFREDHPCCSRSPGQSPPARRARDPAKAAAWFAQETSSTTGVETAGEAYDFVTPSPAEVKQRLNAMAR